MRWRAWRATGAAWATLHEEGFSKKAHVRCRKVPLFGNHDIWLSFFFAFGGVVGIISASAGAVGL